MLSVLAQLALNFVGKHRTEDMTSGTGFSAHMHEPDTQMPLLEGAERMFHF